MRVCACVYTLCVHVCVHVCMCACVHVCMCACVHGLVCGSNIACSFEVCDWLSSDMSLMCLKYVYDFVCMILLLSSELACSGQVHLLLPVALGVLLVHYVSFE